MNVPTHDIDGIRRADIDGLLVVVDAAHAAASDAAIASAIATRAARWHEAERSVPTMSSTEPHAARSPLLFEPPPTMQPNDSTDHGNRSRKASTRMHDRLCSLKLIAKGDIAF
jgi:hypothetical protein